MKLFVPMVLFLQDVSYKLLTQKRAATAIEYALIAGGISVAIVTSVALMGDSLSSMFGTMSTAVSNAAAANSP